MRSNTKQIILVLILSIQKLCVLGFPDFKSFSHGQNDLFDIVIITHEHDLNFSNQFFGTQRHAVQNLSLFNQSGTTHDTFCSKDSVFVIVQSPDSIAFFLYMAQICSALQCDMNDDYHQHRKAFVLLIWPENNHRLSREVFETEVRTYYIKSCLEKGNHVTIDSEFYIMVTNFEESEVTPYLMFELYSIQNQTFLREILFHNRTHYFQPLARKLTRRHDFGGARLRAIAQATTDFFVMVKGFEDDEDVLDLSMSAGYDVDYFGAMASSMNIRPLGVKGKGWIRSDGNGSLIGMGKQLLNGEGDIVIAHSEYMLYRFKKLSFLHPHYVIRLTAYFQQPTATATRDLYLRSIPNKLRLAIVCTSLFTLVCLVVISTIDRKYSGNTNVPDHCFCNVIHWMVAAYCQQGSNNQPRNIPMKIGVLVFSFFTLVVYIAFSTSVVSQLSVPFVPIKTFDDILKSGMNIALDGVTQTGFEFLEKAKDKRLEGPRGETHVVSPSVAVEEIASGGLAFLSLGDEFYLTQRAFNYTDKYLCTLVSRIYVDPIGMPVMAGMLVPKSSPYREFFKYKQIQMREVGVHSRLFGNYMTESMPTCQYIKSRKKVIYLGLNDTITAFVFLLISFLISLTCLCIERMKKTAGRNYFDKNTDQM